MQLDTAMSWKDVSCEFNADSTTLTVSGLDYDTADCTGATTPYTMTFPTLVNGCGPDEDGEELQYYCGTDVTLSQFGSPQHVGWFDNAACSGVEYEWNILSYDGCFEDTVCTLDVDFDHSKTICDTPFVANHEWAGSYTDPVYGGDLHICVSEAGGLIYGQGSFSLMGYMRGTIDVNDVFTGEYWTQGWEGTQGTFSLSLTASGYTGTFTQKPGGYICRWVGG